MTAAWRLWLIVLTLLAALAGCGGGNTLANTVSRDTTPEIKALRELATALLLRDEQPDAEITTQHVQVGVRLSGLGPDNPPLSRNEAEAKTAQLLVQAQGGADFDQLVWRNSYDRLVPGQRPGMFTWVKAALGENRGPTVLQRDQMPESYQRAAWRLKPGEIGVVEHDSRNSNEGFYLLRRLTDDEVKADDPANHGAPSPAIEAMRQTARALLTRPDENATRVTVQHILIGRWMSAPSGKGGILRPDEAEAAASAVFAQAQQPGADFSQLVRDLTYDSATGETPGVYTMVANRADAKGELVPRDGMVKGFGDAAWKLKVGEIGVALYSRGDSPFGYHIIKRLK